MTTLQKTLIGFALIGAILVGVHQTREASKLRQQVQALTEANAQTATLSDQVQVLQRERDRATNALANLAAENTTLKNRPGELLKLRGEVGRLRQENATITSSSPLSKITADPKSTQMMREQQKMGMSMIYKSFARTAKLTPEQTEQFNEMLADHIMENIGNVTTVLRDKLTSEQSDGLFAQQEAKLQEKVLSLLGSEGLAAYQDYTKDLLSSITAEQFKGSLSGDGEAKNKKAGEFAQLLREESLAVLSAAGLPPDYQTVPMLNFRNIASEQEAERGLKLLEDIYSRAVARAGNILSAEELKKFEEFKTAGIKNNSMALTMNRTLMAPLADSK